MTVHGHLSWLILSCKRRRTMLLLRGSTSCLFYLLATTSRARSFVSTRNHKTRLRSTWSTLFSLPRTDQGLADIGTQDSDNKDDDNDDMSCTPAGENEAMPQTSWRQLLQVSSNRSRKIRGSNYVQIATVDADGLPHVRTVVFRGFLVNVPVDHATLGGRSSSCSDLPCVMKMITDNRSTKVQHIAATRGQAEMVWWFPKSNEQYRIRGQLVLVGDDCEDEFLQTARREQWGNLSDAARQAFYDEHIPGQPWSSQDAPPSSEIPAGGRDPTTGQVLQPPPVHYLLMLLVPTACDYLRLGGVQYRQVDVVSNQGNWTAQRVNP